MKVIYRKQSYSYMIKYFYLHRYNGKLPIGNCGKLRSKFELKKRKTANALKPCVKYTSKAEMDKVMNDTYLFTVYCMPL